MSKQALSYIINDNLSSNERLKVYYDFNTGSLFTGISGASNYAFLRNTSPAYNTGTFNGIIVDTASATATGAYFKATGSFLSKNGSGYFPYSNVVITGQPDFNFNDCSVVIDFSNDNYSAGVLFGSYEKIIETVNNQDYISSKGFNIGINDRGKLFFQSLGIDGEYVFTANSIELSRKNTIAMLIGNGNIEFCRFDYLNQNLQSEIFSVDTDYIKNSTKYYIGTSPTFYKGSGISTKTFNGYISNFAIFSGNLANQFLYNFGSGFISEYFYNTGSVINTYTTITGYSTTVLYATGITGYITGVTGYRSVLTGYGNYPTGGFTFSGTPSRSEGSRIFQHYSGDFISYKEEIGFLYSGYSGTYNPTGLNAFDTLGLQNISQNINIYNEQSGIFSTYVNVPLYGVSGVTGYTTEITGSVQTPLYEGLSITGNPTSGVYLTGSSNEYKKDYIYYLEKRI